MFKESNEYPKVLVISINAWKDNTGINTLIELFKFWDIKKIAQIYTKSAMPSTQICNNFFRISENAILKSVFNRKIVTGKQVYNEESISNAEEQAIEQEQKLYKKGRKKQSWFLAIARDIVWLLGKWKTDELNQFIDEYNPEVLFLPIYPTIYMGVIQNYVLKRTGKPAVCYLADDNYTYKPLGRNPLAYVHRFFLRKIVKMVVTQCGQVFVIAPKQKEEYDRIFNVNSIVLTKGIDYSKYPYEEPILHQPIRMVYTGKLIIGRWKSLAAIAEALGEINKEKEHISLDIYTTDTLTKRQERLLNRNGCCVRGAVSLREVERVQSESDVVVFVESLDKEYKNVARLSFSTKITDYLKSGKCILAIGDKEIAPIDYFLKNDSAIVATTYDEIYLQLKRIIDTPQDIVEYSKKAYQCGKENHSVEEIKRIFEEVMRASNNK